MVTKKVRELEWSWTPRGSAVNCKMIDFLGDFANISRMVRVRRILKKAFDSSLKGGHFGFFKINFGSQIKKLSLKSPKHPVFDTFSKISPDKVIAENFYISHNKQLIGGIHKQP